MSTSTGEKRINAIRRGSQIFIVIVICLTVIVVALTSVYGGPPSGIATVTDPLELSPVLTTTSGYLQVQSGQRVTAVYTFTNGGDQVSVSRRIMAAGRGPDYCRRGWNPEDAESFSAMENVVLKPGETRRYERARAFQTPGVYYVKTERQTLDKNWEGFGATTNGKYIIVVDEDKRQPFDTSCITPLPTKPSSGPAVTAHPTPPKSQSTPTSPP